LESGHIESGQLRSESEGVVNRREFVKAATLSVFVAGVENIVVARNSDSEETVVISCHAALPPVAQKRLAEAIHKKTGCRCVIVDCSVLHVEGVVGRDSTFRRVGDGGPRIEVIVKRTGKRLPHIIWAESETGLCAQLVRHGPADVRRRILRIEGGLIFRRRGAQ
jgi:hypothetical protein